MKPRMILALVAMAWGWSSYADAAPRDRATIDDAIDVLDDMIAAREFKLPPALLRDANAVIIAPDVVKGGFLAAARHGHGVLLIRNRDGWSNPIFITITGGSFGFQVGLSATDIFLVIRNQKSLDRILRGNGKLTLGADAAVAAGPVGKELSAATDAQMRAEILSYSHSRGIFAGVALDGDTMRIDWPANDRFYGKRGLTVTDIVGNKVNAPEKVATLFDRLGRLAASGRDDIGPKLPAKLDAPRIP
jgi:lipid-binding SYLF domain-containing protein